MGSAIGGAIGSLDGPGAIGEALGWAIDLAHCPPWRFGRRRLKSEIRRLRRSKTISHCICPPKEGGRCAFRAPSFSIIVSNSPLLSAADARTEGVGKDPRAVIVNHNLSSTRPLGTSRPP